MTQDGDLVLLADARERVRLEGEGLLALADQFDERFLEVVHLILNLPGKVFTTGSGTSGIAARRMAHLFTVCGTPALYLPPMDALHGSMGAVTAGDALIAISRGGASDEINDLARRVQDFGVPVVSLTSAPDSDLAQLADISIILENLEGIDPGGVIAMGSTLVVGAWGDALANVLMLQRGHSWNQVLHNHPAGGVGKMTELPPELATSHEPRDTQENSEA
jgi:arabinose-5-phosphate isomerase